MMGYGVLNYHFFGCGFIEMLMVGEHCRRRGIGLALIAALKSRCRHPKLFTSTNRSNLPMQRLLLNAGFIASGQVDNLDDGDPEQVFFYPSWERKNRHSPLGVSNERQGEVQNLIIIAVTVVLSVYPAA
ncbi:Acetyltransferase (GNAT) family [Serratia fonticola]|uniref:Acetyltransferase (GNAT) family n=1 Tax=Serratia fonticola TaxID=47917 RepID=A0A4U9U3Y4_SERFO|nr:Acetyltransferase (GNAT) family [Serratia fonticola]